MAEVQTQVPAETQTSTADTTSQQNTTQQTDTATTNEGTSLINQTDEGTTEPAKVEGDKSEGEKKTEAKAIVPEKYEPFKAPEGYEYDAKGLEEASTLFKELGLSQEQGQKIMDVYAAKSLEAAKDAGERGQKAYAEMRAGWQAEVKADPEIGKNLPAVKATIGRALDSLGDPKLANDFKAAMDLTGAGDHPAFVKAFYKLAQSVVEGGHVTGGGPSAHGQSAGGEAKQLSIAERIYGSKGPNTALGQRQS